MDAVLSPTLILPIPCGKLGKGESSGLAKSGGTIAPRSCLCEKNSGKLGLHRSKHVFLGGVGSPSSLTTDLYSILERGWKNKERHLTWKIHYLCLSFMLL